MAAVDGSHRLIFRILVQLGLRPEELFALRADDIVGDTLRIDEAIVEGARSKRKHPMRVFTSRPIFWPKSALCCNSETQIPAIGSFHRRRAILGDYKTI